MKLRAMPVIFIIKHFMNETIRNTRVVAQYKPNSPKEIFYDWEFKVTRALYIWEQSK